MEQQQDIILNVEDIKKIEQLIDKMPGGFAIPLFNILTQSAQRPKNEPKEDKAVNSDSKLQQAGANPEALSK